MNPALLYRTDLVSQSRRFMKNYQVRLGVTELLSEYCPKIWYVSSMVSQKLVYRLKVKDAKNSLPLERLTVFFQAVIMTIVECC